MCRWFRLAALVQAKIQHPHSCDIWEIHMDVKQACCAIYHVLEALDSDSEGYRDA